MQWSFSWIPFFPELTLHFFVEMTEKFFGLRRLIVIPIAFDTFLLKSTTAMLYSFFDLADATMESATTEEL